MCYMLHSMCSDHDLKVVIFSDVILLGFWMFLYCVFRRYFTYVFSLCLCSLFKCFSLVIVLVTMMSICYCVHVGVFMSYCKTYISRASNFCEFHNFSRIAKLNTC